MTTLNYNCNGNIFQVHLPPHHLSHEWSSGKVPSDAVTVHPRMFSLMRCTVEGGSIRIRVSPFYYLKNGEFNVVGETFINMTPYLATETNKTLLALIGFNFDTENLEVLTGPEGILSAVTPLLPPTGIPDNFFPSALIRLRQDAIELFETDITDVRFSFMQTGGGGTPGDTVASETTFGISSNAGVATAYSRTDHTHGSPTNPITAHEAAGDPHTGYALEANTVMDGDAAGGVLSGTYPSPGFAVDMATQAELDAHTTDTIDAHDASAISTDVTNFNGNLSAADTTVQAALETLDDLTISTGITVVCTVIQYNNSSPLVVITPPANATILSMQVKVITTFNATGPADIQVGVSGDENRYISTVDLTTLGITNFYILYEEDGTPDQIIITFAPGTGGSQGTAKLYTFYTVVTCTEYAVGNNLLLESGDALLLESGDNLLLEG